MAQNNEKGGTLGTERGTVFCGHVSPMTKTIMDEALEEVRRKGRLDIQERVFAKMKPHDPLADLVAGFSKALLEKLRAAEAKYGYKNDWLRSDWEAECQKHLAEHLAKGDPRDVAAYAAFCWHHGWPTSALEAALAHPGSGDAEPVAWRTIETAPMDGTRVLLYQTGRGAFEGWWHTDWHKAEAWWMDDADSEPEPTHWQPLLATPQAPAQTLQHHTGDGE